MSIPSIDTDEKELQAIPRRLRTQADLDRWKEMDGASVITPEEEAEMRELNEAGNTDSDHESDPEFSDNDVVEVEEGEGADSDDDANEEDDDA